VGDVASRLCVLLELEVHGQVAAGGQLTRVAVLPRHPTDDVEDETVGHVVDGLWGVEGIVVGRDSLEVLAAAIQRFPILGVQYGQGLDGVAVVEPVEGVRREDLPRLTEVVGHSTVEDALLVAPTYSDRHVDPGHLQVGRALPGELGVSIRDGLARRGRRGWRRTACRQAY
jgi:hypothetical protein